MRGARICLGAICLLCLCAPAGAEAIRWDGDESTTWMAARNWSDNRPVSTTLNYQIASSPAGRLATTVATSPFTGRSLSVGTGGTLVVAARATISGSAGLILDGGLVRSNLAAPATLSANHGVSVSAGTMSEFRVDGAALTLSGGLCSTNANTTGGIRKTGAGTLLLDSDAAGFHGPVTIEAGELSVGRDNALGDGTITAAAGGTLRLASGVMLSNPVSIAGRLIGPGGLRSTLNVSAQGVVAPGESPGPMDTGPTTWGPGGVYEWEINDVDAGAGLPVGWDLWNADSLTVAATRDDPFIVRLISLGLDDSAAPVADFDPARRYVWTIVHSSIAIAGFDPQRFDVDPARFANDLDGGSFAPQPSADGHGIELVFTPAPEPATGLLLGGAAAGLWLFRGRVRRNVRR